MTKTPKTYTISFAEIKAFVDDLPKPDSYTGVTCNSGRCLVALAVAKKYRPHRVCVAGADWLADDLVRITFQGRSKGEVWHIVEIPEKDQVNVRLLMHLYDHLGAPETLTTKADVLPLFERLAA